MFCHIIQGKIGLEEIHGHRHGVLTNLRHIDFRICSTCLTATDDMPRSPSR